MQNQDDGEQLLHLKWNNHTNNLMDIIREQYSKQSLVDVTLSCQGKRFRAHRMILSACSPYFQVRLLFLYSSEQHTYVLSCQCRTFLMTMTRLILS
jgi:BTB/POZ domain